MAAVGPHFWIPFWISFLDPIFGIQFWSPFLKTLKKLPPEGPRTDLGPRPSKVSKQNCLGATILGSPPKPGTHLGPHFWTSVWTPFWAPFWSPFLTPCWTHFGPHVGPHFLDPILENDLRKAPGPIWAPGHLKCQSKTVLERPFWGAPQNQGPHFGPHFWTPFWTPCWTPFLDPIFEPHFWIPCWTPFLGGNLGNV